MYNYSGDFYYPMESTITEATENHLKKNENGKFVKQKMADKFMHTKCSTESCFGSYNNKNKEVKDSKSLGVYGLIYEDNGIETSKKPTPVTSLMEEFEHEYPLSSKKHCVEALTLTCPNSESSKVEEKLQMKSIDELNEAKHDATVTIKNPTAKRTNDDSEEVDETEIMAPKATMLPEALATTKEYLKKTDGLSIEGSMDYLLYLPNWHLPLYFLWYAYTVLLP